MSDLPPAVTIEAPGLAELDRIVELWEALVRNQRGYGTTLRADDNAANARSWLSGRMTFDGIRIARTEDDIVGFVTYALRADQFVHDGRDGIVHNLFVREDYRGHGIGTGLLERAESLLADRGVEHVRLEILAANEAAEAFYRERGYDPYRLTLRKSITNGTGGT